MLVAAAYNGGPDERVPQLDLAPGDLHEAGALRLGQGVRAGARGGRGTLHGGELHRVVRGSHEQQLLRTWREPTGSVEEDPLDGRGDRKLPGQARPAGQLVRRERLRHLYESERVAPGACQELSGHRRAHGSSSPAPGAVRWSPPGPVPRAAGWAARRHRRSAHPAPEPRTASPPARPRDASPRRAGPPPTRRRASARHPRPPAAAAFRRPRRAGSTPRGRPGTCRRRPRRPPCRTPPATPSPAGQEEPRRAASAA